MRLRGRNGEQCSTSQPLEPYGTSDLSDRGLQARALDLEVEIALRRAKLARRTTSQGHPPIEADSDAIRALRIRTGRRPDLVEIFNERQGIRQQSEIFAKPLPGDKYWSSELRGYVSRDETSSRTAWVSELKSDLQASAHKNRFLQGAGTQEEHINQQCQGKDTSAAKGSMGQASRAQAAVNQRTSSTIKHIDMPTNQMASRGSDSKHAKTGRVADHLLEHNEDSVLLLPLGERYMARAGDMNDQDKADYKSECESNGPLNIMDLDVQSMLDIVAK